MFYGQKKSSFRFTTLIVVLSVHVGVIFIPLGIMLLMPAKPKPIAFRVKLGGTEPSHAPELGPPERIRPTGNSGVGAPPPPPKKEEPVAPPPPPAKKVIPTPPPAKKEVKPKVKPKVKPVVKPKVKPVVKPKIDRKKIEQERQKKLLQQKQAREKQKRLQQQREKQKRLEAERRRRQQQEVHHDNRGDNWDPNKPFGGTNTNIAVPIGNRDRGQKIGKVDSRTPAGGASVKEEEYWKKFTEYFYERWQAPAGIFVTEESAVEIEIVWDSRGKVLSKRIIQTSPNRAVTQSVKLMLDNLDYVPTPPAGIATTARFRLISQ